MATSPPNDAGQNIRVLGAFVVTLVVCGIAVLDQLQTGSVSGPLLGALLVIFAGWLGENLIDLIQTLFGRR